MIKAIGKYNGIFRALIVIMFVFFGLFPTHLYSTESDSTVKQEIVSIIMEGIHQMNHTQYDSAIAKFIKADSLAYLHSNLKLQANSQYNLGVVYYRSGDYVKCGEYFDKSLESISQTDDTLSLAQLNLGIGILYKKKGDYKNAVNFVFKAIDVLEQSENTQLLASAYNTIAGIQNKMQNDTLALKYYHQSLLLYQDIKALESTAQIQNNLGNFYLERNQFQFAKTYLRLSLKLKQRSNTTHTLPVTANTLGELYLKTHQPDSANYYITMAMAYDLLSSNSIYLIESYHLKTKYFLAINNFDSASFYVELAHPMIIKNDLKDQLLINYELSSLIFEQMGEYKKSLEYSRLFENLQEEILTSDLAQDINNLQFQYETEKKDLQINNLNELNRLKTESIKTRNKGLIIITILLIISLILMILVYRAYQQKSKAHNKIRFLMHEKQHRTKNNLQLLSSVLSMQSLFSPQLEKDLSKEIENRVQSIVLLERLLYDTHIDGDDIEISQYLQELILGLTEAYEHHSKIEVIKDIASLMIAAEQAKFIGLLVNEIITNSLKYAFEKIDHPQIQISFLPQSENTYRLILRDNGPGITEKNKTKNSNSLGMKLIDTMSRQLKGDYVIENRQGFYYELMFEVKKGLN